MSEEIQLSQGKVAIVDDDDFEMLNAYKWHYDNRVVRCVYGEKNKVRKKVRVVPMASQILGERDGYIVDHVNGNKLDNRRQNLRYATKAQNARNAAPMKHTSRYKGVGWYPSRNKWRVYCRVDNVRYFIGYFDDETEAARAYNARAMELHGEFARLNMIEGESYVQ